MDREPITHIAPCKLPRNSRESLTGRGPSGYRATFADTTMIEGTGPTKAEATDAMFRALRCYVDSPMVLWTQEPDETRAPVVFLIQGQTGGGGYAYEIIRQGKSSGCYCPGFATREDAITAARKHIAQWEEA